MKPKRRPVRRDSSYTRKADRRRRGAMRTAPEDVAEQDLIFSVFQGWVCTSSTSRTRRWASAAIIGWPPTTPGPVVG
jgi:hypothetical protein